MNCKPGDLACVVRVPQSEPHIEAILREQLIGKFVRVVRLTVGSEGALDAWKILEPVRITLPAGRGTGTMIIDLFGIEDSVLQPVRGVPVHDEQLDEVPA
ncbi:hypothetical protein B0G76_1326 [Paraburkholderia sp. BL23I1N1]|uniref:hypothetical protein n=1 Tax=Paraburkholderia sp. BL23I1N1 TaxID=1938802 RepID=UPI000E770FC3|nr:hypothetical protein [Paraburkholderia sp. BL23I1N1]RKE35265.1 hypothetical protein B0G76_1326 [Paraburkholderia sp. BL23I1N1]